MGRQYWDHRLSQPPPVSIYIRSLTANLLMRKFVGRLVTAIALVVPACAPSDAAPARAGDYAPARFADPDRIGKLRTALPAIDSIFRTFATSNHVPGIAYGVIIDGQLAHRGVAGLRNIADNAPVDSASVFRIASMTKSFTALAILKLRDEGKLALDDLAAKYVPELAGLTYPTTDSPHLTIRHLLSHSEGFPEDNPWGDRQLEPDGRRDGGDDARRDSILQSARHRVRVLELRIRDPRPHRGPGLRADRTRPTSARRSCCR